MAKDMSDEAPLHNEEKRLPSWTDSDGSLRDELVTSASGEAGTTGVATPAPVFKTRVRVRTSVASTVTPTPADAMRPISVSEVFAAAARAIALQERPVAPLVAMASAAACAAVEGRALAYATRAARRAIDGLGNSADARSQCETVVRRANGSTAAAIAHVQSALRPTNDVTVVTARIDDGPTAAAVIQATAREHVSPSPCRLCGCIPMSSADGDGVQPVRREAGRIPSPATSCGPAVFGPIDPATTPLPRIDELSFLDVAEVATWSPPPSLASVLERGPEAWDSRPFAMPHEPQITPVEPVPYPPVSATAPRRALHRPVDPAPGTLRQRIRVIEPQIYKPVPVPVLATAVVARDGPAAATSPADSEASTRLDMLEQDVEALVREATVEDAQSLRQRIEAAQADLERKHPPKQAKAMDVGALDLREADHGEADVVIISRPRPGALAAPARPDPHEPSAAGVARPSLTGRLREVAAGPDSDAIGETLEDDSYAAVGNGAQEASVTIVRRGADGIMKAASRTDSLPVGAIPAADGSTITMPRPAPEQLSAERQAKR